MIERYPRLARNLFVFKGAIDRLARAWIRSLLGQPIAVGRVAVRKLADRVGFRTVGHAQQAVKVVVRIGRRFRFPAVEITLDLYLGPAIPILVVAIGIAREGRLPRINRPVEDQLYAIRAIIRARIATVDDRTVRILDRLDQAVLPIRISCCPGVRADGGQSIAGVVGVVGGEDVWVDDLCAATLDVVVVLDGLTQGIIMISTCPCLKPVEGVVALDGHFSHIDLTHLLTLGDGRDVAVAVILVGERLHLEIKPRLRVLTV